MSHPGNDIYNEFMEENRPMKTICKHEPITEKYGYFDAQADIENNRPRKWDAEGNLISIKDVLKGFAKKHCNPIYVKGYCERYGEI